MVVIQNGRLPKTFQPIVNRTELGYTVEGSRTPNTCG